MRNRKSNTLITCVQDAEPSDVRPSANGNNGLTVIDVFCGCGGSSYGFKLAGFDVRAAIDKNPLAIDSYKLNFPDAGVLTEEIVDAEAEIVAQKLLTKAKLSRGECTVLLGCPPCQGFCRLSKDGVKDPRNGLILSLSKIAAAIQPEFCVIENVPGLPNGSGVVVRTWISGNRSIRDAGASPSGLPGTVTSVESANKSDSRLAVTAKVAGSLVRLTTVTATFITSP